MSSNEVEARRMSLRLMVMLALAALAAAACDHDPTAEGNDEAPLQDSAAINDASPAPTTPLESVSTTTALATTSVPISAVAEQPEPTSTTTTTTALPNPDFEAQLAEVMRELDDVGDQMCDLLDVFQLDFDEQPTTTDQVTSAVAATVQLLESLAAVAPVDDADTFHKTAAAFEREAAAHAYSPEWMTGYTDVSALATDDFLDAIERLQRMLWDDCLDSDPNRGKKP
jgi:hypothetical protein